MFHHRAVSFPVPVLGFLLVVFAIGLIGCGPKRVRLAAPVPADPAPGDVAPFSHHLFHDVLADTVDPETGRVNYALVARDHLPALERYLAEASVASPGVWPTSDQKAFWINVHNAAALHVIASDWDALSAGRKGLRTGLLSPDPAYRVAGGWHTLADMRRHIIRHYDDARMIYALHWGARGSAPLHLEPYRAATLELDLADARDRYIASRRGLYIEGNTLIVEGLFALYADQLLPDREPLPAARQLLGEDTTARVTGVERRRFDWELEG